MLTTKKVHMLLDKNGNETSLKSWIRENKITRGIRIEDGYAGDPLVKLYSGRRLRFQGEVDEQEWSDLTTN